MAKIMAAMSGGVDSSVTACLLREQGHSVTGVTMKLFDHKDDACGLDPISRTCCSLTDAEDARSVCRKMGIPHYVFNLRREFGREVIDRFVEEYRQGHTPNPCIDCNRYLKFGVLQTRREMLGLDAVATGHYVQVGYDSGSGRYQLRKAKDLTKDQSYVLYMATQEQLARSLFPLGGLTKTEVREIAGAHGFVNAKKPDSQDICFVVDGKYGRFIEEYTGHPMEPGDFLDTAGTVIGRHQGLSQYTIGQRKGLGMAFGQPMYVCRKDAAANTVTIGPHEALFSTTLTAQDVNWIAIDRLEAPLRAAAKIRYNAQEQPATIHPLSAGEVLVEFDQPQRAIASGQAVVFYDGDLVIGGATIR